MSMIIALIVCDCFFFFKQKTAYEMLSGDWSSDVCSSDLEHGFQARRKLSAFRHAIRNVCGDDLALGPDDALGHRRLGDEERGRDLLGGEAGDRAQRERDLGLLGKRGVAAGEDQT